MPLLRVGIIMGGKSVEREVSFNSGRTVYDHLDRSLYEVIPLYQTQMGTLFIVPWQFVCRGKTSDFEQRLSTDAQRVTWDDLKNIIDFMFIATHGRYAEDGTLQGMLEILSIPYLGSKTMASAVSMDKAFQKKILRHNGIPVAPGIVVAAHTLEHTSTAHIMRELAANNIAAPWIIKPHKEGSSIGVSVAHDHDSLEKALKAACYADARTAQDVLIETKLEGMEFSCIVLTDYRTNTYLPLPPTEIVIEENTHFYDYDQKYMPGRATKHTPPRCSHELITKIQNTCIATTKALGFSTMSRIDGFVTADETVYIIDPNTLSGMAPASFLFREAAEIGMGHAELINHLIATELKAYGLLDTVMSQTKTINTQHKKKRIAVLMGGNSHEREISLESGRNVCYKLDKQKYTVVPMFVSEAMELFHISNALLVRNSTSEIAQITEPSMQISWSSLPDIADFVFIALHGGNGENGNVQGALEMLDLPYNGSSVLASALCMNKYVCNTFLKNEGFDVPASAFVTKAEWAADAQSILQTITQTLPFPLIVKPHDDGCSVMVQKIKTIDQLQESIEQLFAQGKHGALIEECIIGMELTVGVTGNHTPQALVPSQVIVSKDILSIEEKFLPGAGENQTPARLSSEEILFVQKTMEMVYSAVGCKGYARIDCFYQDEKTSPIGKGRVVIIEINTLPGMTPATCIFHQAAELGLSPSAFIDHIIALGFQEHSVDHSPMATAHQADSEHVTRYY
jgi:D-alanine--D-alanine ligase